MATAGEKYAWWMVIMVTSFVVIAKADDRVPIVSKKAVIYALTIITIGVLLLLMASIRGVLIRTCRMYWVIAAPILFFPVNRVVTDIRLGVDSGSTNMGTLHACAIFAVLIVGPIVWLRLRLHHKGSDGLPLFWGYAWMAVALLFLVLLNIEEFNPTKLNNGDGLEGRGGLSPMSILVPLAIVAMGICSGLAHRRYKLKEGHALAVGVGSLLVIALIGTQLGFNQRPRKRMTYHSYDSGTVTLYYSWPETAEGVIQRYRNGETVGYGNGIRWGDEDFEYLLTVNGLQLLLILLPVGLGMEFLLNRAIQKGRMKPPTPERGHSILNLT